MAEVRVISYNAGVQKTGGLADIATMRAAGGLIWVDVTEPDLDTLKALGTTFDLHELAIEDSLHTPQRSKFDPYPDQAFIVWNAPYIDPKARVVRLHVLTLFIGKDYLVTTHATPQLDAIENAWNRAGELLDTGVSWAVHAILDRATDEVAPILDKIADELTSLEQAMLDGADKRSLRALYGTRRELLKLRKVVPAERDVIREITRLNALVAPEQYLYFQDIGDHLARQEDTIDTYRDVATGVMDLYLTAQSNKMNQIMKQLTIVATIFMPLQLISSIYGMNFKYMPELNQAWGYPIVLMAMVGIGLAMYMWFRSRGWD
jgi:magnesium transporter